MSREAAKSPPHADRGSGVEARWRIVFIGDHGRVVAFRHLRAMLVLIAGLVLLSLVAVAVLAFGTHRLHQRGRALEQELESARARVRELVREKDRLAAQVFLVETRMKETLEGVGRPPFERAPGSGKPPAGAPPDLQESREAGASSVYGR